MAAHTHAIIRIVTREHTGVAAHHHKNHQIFIIHFDILIGHAAKLRSQEIRSGRTVFTIKEVIARMYIGNTTPSKNLRVLFVSELKNSIPLCLRSYLRRNVAVLRFSEVVKV